MASKIVTLVPSGYTELTSLTTSSSYPISNGYADTSSSTYALFTLSTSTTGYLYYTFNTSSIPADATNITITAKARLRVSSTTRVTNTVCRLYSGSTAKGSNTTFSTTTTTTFTLSPGTGWTRSDLNDLRCRVGGTGSSSTSSKQIRVYGIEVTITYDEPEPSGPPVITVGTPSRSVISDESGYDQCVCTFTCNQTLQQWEARATKAGVSPAHGVGLLVESGTTLAAGATGTITVDNEELTGGDGQYLITVYGQNMDGTWSDENPTYFIPSGASALITSDSKKLRVLEGVS